MCHLMPRAYIHQTRKKAQLRRKTALRRRRFLLALLHSRPNSTVQNKGQVKYAHEPCRAMIELRRREDDRLSKDFP